MTEATFEAHIPDSDKRKVYDTFAKFIAKETKKDVWKILIALDDLLYIIIRDRNGKYNFSEEDKYLEKDSEGYWVQTEEGMDKRLKEMHAKVEEVRCMDLTGKEAILNRITGEVETKPSEEPKLTYKPHLFLTDEWEEYSGSDIPLTKDIAALARALSHSTGRSLAEVVFSIQKALSGEDTQSIQKLGFLLEEEQVRAYAKEVETTYDPDDYEHLRFLRGQLLLAQFDAGAKGEKK